MPLNARYLAVPAVLLGLTALPDQARAWGKFGHLTVCDLAYRNLTDASQAKLIKLLKSKEGGITVKGKDGVADRHYTSFNLGCLEEDELPRKHPDDHFINVSRDTKSIDGPTCPNSKSCVFAGIERDLKTLKDETKSDEERVFALMAIGHWIGDIHQPLHISFADDRGGNSIDVKLKGKCGTSSSRPDNLHSVWDNCLLEAGLFERVRKQKGFKKTWSKNTITYRAVSTLATTSHAEAKTFVNSAPWQWAAESYKITLDPKVLYCVQVGTSCQYSATVASLPKNGKKRLQQLDQAYLAAFERVAEDRVKRAGFRLAHLLNQALDPNYKEPVKKDVQKP